MTASNEPTPGSGSAVLGVFRSGAPTLDPRAWLTLITLCAAQFLIALDFSIVTVALPEIGRDLDFGATEDLQWVMTAFILPTASLLLLFGRASDLFGRRRLFVTGLVLVTAFSLIAGLASSAEMLVAARAGQGIGSAMIGPAALALLTSSFPEGPQRDRALGVSGALLSLGFVAGAISGGVITSALSWRWTMLILVAIGAIVLIAALLLLPKTRERSGARLDLPGATLATAGLLALVYGVSTAGEAGWTSAPTLVALIGAAVLLASFLAVESRNPAALAPLHILNSRTVKWGGLTGFITFGMTGATTVLLSLYMQDVLDYSPLAAGLAFLAEGVFAIAAGALAPRLIGARGPSRTLIAGLICQAASTGAMVLLPAGGNLGLLLITTAGLGFGHVLAVVAFIGIMTSGLPNGQQGLAGGLAQTAQQLGGAVCIPVLATVVAGQTGAPGSATDLLGGLHAGFLVSASVALAGALIAALLLRLPAAAPKIATAA